MQLAGTYIVTTEPAAIIELSPIFIPPIIMTLLKDFDQPYRDSIRKTYNQLQKSYNTMPL